MPRPATRAPHLIPALRSALADRASWQPSDDTRAALALALRLLERDVSDVTSTHPRREAARLLGVSPDSLTEWALPSRTAAE